MSDAMSDGARVNRAWNALDNALYELDMALDNMYDAVFGLPIGAQEELEIVLKKYGLALKKTES
jgi:hypothetical protein